MFIYNQQENYHNSTLTNPSFMFERHTSMLHVMIVYMYIIHTVKSYYHVDFIVMVTRSYYTTIGCITVVQCSSSPCVHGTCADTSSGFNCTCAPRYVGVKCDARKLEH